MFKGIFNCKFQFKVREEETPDLGRAEVTYNFDLAHIPSYKKTFQGYMSASEMMSAKFAVECQLYEDARHGFVVVEQGEQILYVPWHHVLYVEVKYSESKGTQNG